jgi:hypothetical protein
MRRIFGNERGGGVWLEAGENGMVCCLINFALHPTLSE